MPAVAADDEAGAAPVKAGGRKRVKSIFDSDSDGEPAPAPVRTSPRKEPKTVSAAAPALPAAASTSRAQRGRYASPFPLSGLRRAAEALRVPQT